MAFHPLRATSPSLAEHAPHPTPLPPPRPPSAKQVLCTRLPAVSLPQGVCTPSDGALPKAALGALPSGPTAPGKALCGGGGGIHTLCSRSGSLSGGSGWAAPKQEALSNVRPSSPWGFLLIQSGLQGSELTRTPALSHASPV